MHTFKKKKRILVRTFLKYIYLERGLLTTFESTTFYNNLILQFSKSKQSIQTVQHDIYIKMCLEIKFYIFLNFFIIY